MTIEFINRFTCKHRFFVGVDCFRTDIVHGLWCYCVCKGSDVVYLPRWLYRVVVLTM